MRKFSILQQLTSSFAATDDIRATANLMLDLATTHTRAQKGSLMLVNDQDELTIFTARGLEANLIRTYKARIGEGIAGTVAEQRVAVLVEDIEKDERFRATQRDRYETRSFISCPIVRKNRLLGVLNINDKSDGTAFTADEFTLIKIMADQAAIALENAFLLTQLRAKASELEDINRKLIRADILKSEFLGRMSHELRTPLNAINGAIYYLQKGQKISHPERQDFYDIITKETSGLIHLVENMLAFLRLEDESRVMTKTIMSIADLLKDLSASRTLRLFLSQKDIRLDVQLPRKVSDIVGDKTRVSQLLINMIEGLSQYLQRDDAIEITLTEDDVIVLHLRCSREMPAPLLADLFHPPSVFAVERSEDRLKLYLARKVIESHSWKMTAENEDGRFCLQINIPKSERQKIEAAVNMTVDRFIDFLSDMMEVGICSVMLGDDLTGELTIKSARGLDDEIVTKTRLKVGDSIAGWVALEGRPLFIEDVENDRRFMRRSIRQYDTASLISVPIKAHDKVIGVINLNNKKSKSPFTMQDFYAASVLGERISHFFEKLYRGDFSEDALRQFLSSFDNLLTVGRKYRKKGGSSAAVILKIMERLRTTEDEKRMAAYVSMIYDLGLATIDERISKAKKLTPADTRAVRDHPSATISLLSDFEFSADVKSAILHHHERFDGSGYPQGLKGDEIPFISRILHVVDAFCAMTTDRPYRKARSALEALADIKAHAGSMYDPLVVNALEEVVTSP